MRKTLWTAACISLSLLISGGLPVATRLAAADDPAKPGPAQMISPARAFVRLWQNPGEFQSVTFASVLGNRLYLGGAPRGLQAVDTETGHTEWVHPGILPGEFPPVERLNVLYFVEGGRLVTIEPTTGKELSRSTPRFSLFTPAFPGEGYCLFASGDGYVYAIRVENGAKRWRAAIDGQPTGSTWNEGNMMYFTTSRGILYGASIQQIELVWSHQLPRESCSPPALAGKVIYVGSSDYYLYALDALIGDVQWRLSLSAPVLETPVIVGSRVYAATTEHLIHAVDLDTHKEVWPPIPGDRLLTTTPEHLIFLRKDKDTNVIGMADAATGKVISEMVAENYVLFAAPAEGGIVYAIGKTGDVLAIADRPTIVAREAAREAARKAALLAPAAAPSAAPTTAPTAPAAAAH